MCIIAFNPIANDLPDSDILDNCWVRNPHGAGFMYNDVDRLVVVKGCMTKLALESALEEHRPRWRNRRLAIHWRIATHGKTDEINTHPHVVVQDALALVHNGVLDYEDPKDEISDSAIFAQIIAGLDRPQRAVYDLRIRRLIDGIVGPSSKVIFLNAKGDYWIYNKAAFDRNVETDGWMYSNDGYLGYTGYFTGAPTGMIGAQSAKPPTDYHKLSPEEKRAYDLETIMELDGEVPDDVKMYDLFCEKYKYLKHTQFAASWSNAERDLHEWLFEPQMVAYWKQYRDMEDDWDSVLPPADELEPEVISELDLIRED